MTEEDEGWRSDERENYKDVVQRVNQFLDKLVKRPETNIVVISHGVFIECCFYTHFPDALIGGDRVRNCDLFATECDSVDGVFTSLRNVRRIE
jgi:broad specificity phosphatase PhoE